MELNELTSSVINAAIEVHRTLGPGLLESVYQRCLATELAARGVAFRSEVPVPICYRDQRVHDEGFRIDLLVEDRVLVELKSVEQLLPVHKKQLLTYLRLTGKTAGLLINFNESLLKDGIVRIVNNLVEGHATPGRGECEKGISRGDAQNAEPPSPGYAGPAKK